MAIEITQQTVAVTVNLGVGETIEAAIENSSVEITTTGGDVVVAQSMGLPGKSAYEIAITNGFVGSEAAWLTSLQGEDGSAGGAWGGITGTLSAQTDLQSALNAKASTSHNHDASYAAIGHDHAGTYAPISHTHAQSDVTGLTASLAGKADTSHTHSTSDVTGLDTALSGKASTSHNHDASYTPLAHAGSGGTAHANAVASGAAGFLTGSDKAKLDGIATAATANDTDANLKNRANHTGTQAITTTTLSATSRIVGRTTAGAGAAEELSMSAVKTALSLSKSDVGLSNVDNTSDANKPVSSAQQSALDLKANLTSATFSGAIAASNLSGTNTGDETYSTITTKLSGGSGGGTSNFLRADGTFAAPPGGGGATWGSVTGTLSSQTDLQSALDGKAATSHNHDASYVAASHAGAGGTAHANVVAAGAAGFMTGADKTKLDGIASGATANTGTVTSVTITQPAAGITVTSSGTAITTSGTRTIALANDLAAVEALSSTGLVRRTGTDTWTAGTAVALTEVATQAANTFVANGTGSTAAPTAISAATARTILNVANGATANTGTVTTVSVTTANGVSGSVATATSTPAITLTLGAITPSSVASSGAISGTTGTFSGVASATNLFQGTKYILSGGKPTSGEVVLADIATSSYTIVQGNCVVKSRVAATGSSVFTFKKDGTTIGTATFAAAATTATVSISSGAVTSGQLITIECPATADATLEDIAFLLRV